jgi:Rad3-related DNA helicase
MIYDLFIKVSDNKNIIRQKIDMSEYKRKSFIWTFRLEQNKPVIGFAVMSGVFGEGIDLTGEYLKGAVIIGTGLPKVSAVQNEYKIYYSKTGKNGYKYAFIYPGMQRVLQAAGRVIRTETDKGSVLLLDDRYLGRDYQNLFPEHWKPVYLNSKNDIKKHLPI